MEDIDRKGYSELERFIYMLPARSTNKSFLRNNYDAIKWKRTFRELGPAGNHSTFYLDQTPEQFFGTIDILADRNGVDERDVAKYVQWIWESKNPDKFKQELVKMARPVLRGMLAKGYSRADLRVR
jgi:hypothetical protein